MYRFRKKPSSTVILHLMYFAVAFLHMLVNKNIFLYTAADMRKTW